MAMKLVKKTDEYSIFQRGDGRYAVKGANKKAVNGTDKAKILLEEGLIKVKLAADPVPEAPEEEAVAAEEPAAEAEAAEEAPAAEEASESAEEDK